MLTFFGLCAALLMVSGLATEFVAVAAMDYWPLRRRLPSPFALMSWGGIAFFVGLAALALARTLQDRLAP
jgi:hypothetical protein